MARDGLAALVVVLALAAFAARADAQDALPATRLPLRLIGTVVAAQAERSIAVIDNQGQTAVVRAGDAIGSARVQEIHKDGVVLAQAGRLESLALEPVAVSRPAGTQLASADGASGVEQSGDGVDAGERDARRSATATRARQSARMRKRASAVPARAARSQDDDVQSQVSQAVGNDKMLVDLSAQARYKPLLDEEGHLRGVAIMDVRPDSTLERLGLRSGDVVVSVAGVRVDNSAAAFNALRSLDPRAGGEVLVERGGLPTRITVPPGAL